MGKAKNPKFQGAVLYKYLIVPPMGANLKVIFCEKAEDSKSALNYYGIKNEVYEALDENVQGQCYHCFGGIAIILKLDCGISVLLHELSHAVDYIILDFGFHQGIEGTEFRATLHDYLFNEVLHWLNKKPFTIQDYIHAEPRPKPL